MARIPFATAVGLLAVAAAAWALWPRERAGTPPDAGEPGPLTVSILSADKSAVTRGPFNGNDRNRPIYDLDLQVENTSATDQKITVMSCGYPRHWKSDSGDVGSVGIMCEKNSTDTLTLKPGDTYRRTVPVLVRKRSSFPYVNSGVTFRMGFAPIDSGQTFWSAEYTLTPR